MFDLFHYQILLFFWSASRQLARAPLVLFTDYNIEIQYIISMVSNESGDD